MRVVRNPRRVKFSSFQDWLRRIADGGGVAKVAAQAFEALQLDFAKLVEEARRRKRRDGRGWGFGLVGVAVRYSSMNWPRCCS